MATPAEIIASRVNGTYVADPEDAPVRRKPDVEQRPAKSLGDQSAFPVLGGGASSHASASATTSWGPLSKGGPLGVPTPALAPRPAEALKSAKFKSSTLQEAFSLDAEDQLNVNRPEFVKILTSIKAATGASIECTISQHTKRRTFLISGKPEQVKNAKRLVIRKLTKPIAISFQIPAKVRAKVIGAQGRTLKPIIAQTETKIDIGLVDPSASPSPADGELDADDVFAQTVPVTLEGDAEGCKQAKQLILEIVKEETKNLQIKVAVSEQMRPFAKAALKELVDKAHEDGSLEFTLPSAKAGSAVIILGDRAQALEAREEVRAALDAFELSLVSLKVQIPVAQHQLLPTDEILEQYLVLIRPEGDRDVQFVGQEANIFAAQKAAKAAIADYCIEVLDMSKAHKGNLAHVRAVAAMFTKYGVFSAIAAEHGVRINVPDLALAHDPPALPVEIIVKSADSPTAKQTRRAIVSAVNAVTPDQTREISDLDLFFEDKFTAALDAVPGAKHVTLDGKLMLFDYGSDAPADLDDFGDAESSVLEDCMQALVPVYELQKNFTTEVLDVPAASQKYIEGPNGSTLRTVLARVPKDSVHVRLHSDGTATAADKVYVQGLQTHVKEVTRELLDIVAEASEYSSQGGYSTVVEVPTFVLSRVIGKGGAGLNSLREEYGVELEVERERDARERDARDEDKSARTGITIRGIRRNAEGAKKALASVAAKLADETLVRMQIENRYHRRIIGPSFSAINRLQDRYNVKIRFPSELQAGHSDAPANEHEVTIRGSSKAVARAEHELKQLHQYEKENGLTSIVQVPTKAISRVLGKDSNNIKDIAAATGIEYRFTGDRKQEEESGMVGLELTGSRAALSEAEAKIRATVSEVENSITKTLTVNPKYIRDLVGPGGSVMRGMISKAGGDGLSRKQYSRLITVPEEGLGLGEVVFEGDKAIVDKLVAQVEQLVAQREALVDDTCHVAKDKHRLIIGPGGSTRAALQEEFGVRINIPSQESSSSDISLHGLPEQIVQLKAKLAELTRDEWNDEVHIPAAVFSVVTSRGTLFKTLRDDLGVEVRHGNRLKDAQKLNKRALPAAPEGTVTDDAFNFVTRPLVWSSDADGKTIPCRLVGSEEATAKAAQILKEQLAMAEAATVEGWAYVQDKRALPRIVGTFGSKILQMRKDTGAFIMVPRTSEEASNVIYLVGTPESLASAEAQLKAAVKA